MTTKPDAREALDEFIHLMQNVTIDPEYEARGGARTAIAKIKNALTPAVTQPGGDLPEGWVSKEAYGELKDDLRIMTELAAALSPKPSGGDDRKFNRHRTRRYVRGFVTGFENPH